EWLIARPVVDVRGRDAGRPVRAPMESAAERDDAGPAGHPAGELERAVDDLRARIQEHHRIERLRERRRELDGEARDRLREAERRDRTHELVDLRMDGGGHARMCVAERGDRDPVGEVEVGTAVAVEQPMADAVAPRPLEIAPEDGCQVGLGEGRVVVTGVGRHRSIELLDSGVGRVYGRLSAGDALLRSATWSTSP